MLNSSHDCRKTHANFQLVSMPGIEETVAPTVEITFVQSAINLSAEMHGLTTLQTNPNGHANVFL